MTEWLPTSKPTDLKAPIKGKPAPPRRALGYKSRKVLAREAGTDAYLTAMSDCCPTQLIPNVRNRTHSAYLRSRYPLSAWAEAMNRSGINPAWQIKMLMELVRYGHAWAYQELKALLNMVLKGDLRSKCRRSTLNAMERIGNGSVGIGEVDGGVSGGSVEDALATPTASTFVDGSTDLHHTAKLSAKSLRKRTRWDD